MRKSSNVVNEHTVGGAVWLLLGAAFAVESVRLGVGVFREPGPGFTSLLAAILMLWQAGVLLLSGLGGQRAGDARRERIDWRPLWPVLVALPVYVGSLPYLGFVPASFVFVLVLMLLSDRRRWKQALGISALAVALCHLVFVVGLGVRLPAGLLKLGLS